MQVKDMFLKNERFFYSFFIIIILLFSCKAYSVTEDRTKVLNYLNSLNFFSASFLQDDGKSLNEGKVFIGTKRVRVEYFLPTKILIILDEDKAMYYDYELEEDEFFNPKNTNAWFFYNIFRNPVFFEDSEIKVEDNELMLKKNGLDNGKNYLIRIYFEKKPLVLRGIDVKIDEDYLKLSIFNHNYNEDFSENFFKLINPKFFN